ncbi:MAG: glutaredoxin 2 [Spirochaetota bacterium]
MKLYHYDHCPYCVRTRMIIGWKNLEVEEIILANADEQSHYDLIGAKMVPILEKDDGSRMKESLDIVAYIDANYGPPLLRSGTEEGLEPWLEKSADPIRHLVHPRNIRVFTQDFPTQADCDYYEAKKSQSIGSFAAAFADSERYIERVAALMDELKSLLPADDVRSYDDIFLFPVLRSVSHVKGLLFPREVYSYMERISRETKVPLLFEQAI